jgi:hypothetical protein
MGEDTGAETVYLRGAGGIVWAHALPLPVEIEKQMTRQELVRVNADGSDWVDEATGVAPAVARPADSALKPEWVGYAVWLSEQRGEPISVDTADAMTKADLIARYGG